MPLEYARLDLVREINTANGGHSREVVVMRLTARTMIDVLGEAKTLGQLNRLVSTSCKAINGTGKDLVSFQASELDAADGAELSAIVASMSAEADGVDIGDGDGVLEPITYNLRYPINLKGGAPEDDGEPMVVRQLQFEAKRLGDLSDFLDARGPEQEFFAFMRSFGTLLGTTLPMTDGIIGALDALDYLVIRRKILGKLTASRGRWRKTSI